MIDFSHVAISHGACPRSDQMCQDCEGPNLKSKPIRLPHSDSQSISQY